MLSFPFNRGYGSVEYRATEQLMTLAIDAATRANLELTRTLSGERKGSLLDAIDRTVSAGGDGCSYGCCTVHADKPRARVIRVSFQSR